MKTKFILITIFFFLLMFNLYSQNVYTWESSKERDSHMKNFSISVVNDPDSLEILIKNMPAYFDFDDYLKKNKISDEVHRLKEYNKKYHFKYYCYSKAEIYNPELSKIEYEMYINFKVREKDDSAFTFYWSLENGKWVFCSFSISDFFGRCEHFENE